MDYNLYHRILLLHFTFEPTPLHALDAALHPLRFDVVEHVDVDWKGICNNALTVLQNRERIIIQKRYGLIGEQAMTLEEVGEEYHLTRERIRQIQEKAEDRLRRRLDFIRLLVVPAGENGIIEEINVE